MHWQGFQFVFPVITHHDCLLLLRVLFDRVSLSNGVLHKLFNWFWMKSVHGVKEECPITYSALWIGIWEIIFHSGQRHEIIIKSFYIELIEAFYVNLLYF